MLAGGPGADVFSCGKGEDTTTDYNPDEGDLKAASCENFSRPRGIRLEKTSENRLG